ncbi:stage II sporulation protein M [Allostreptomyces psammosilenae]|uniref:Putative membrane protein SpoIIM required for sporulation n=1 Tax=Allostreptomyces psammosilenae TaxID=1892865 RepID=A0A852ZUV5_9ACTN|nr:stage II sporulation protein M [Allostreptomyces psammosilenae]NYI06166.1 putative membrane protein SpoIIM required for sporulation [Allostreptomyces psammosilenae]
MDIDVFVAAHQHEWQRLDALCKRRGRLSGTEADELVALYQRAATHLSLVRSAAPDPALVGRLSALVAAGRSAVTGARSSGWRDAARYFTRSFPAALYRTSSWWMPTMLVCWVVAALAGWWVAENPHVQASLAAPEEIRQLTRPGGDFETYYSSEPAAAFATQVWVNNAWVAAQCLAFGAFLGIPVLYVLAVNILNVAASAGLMASVGRLDVFFGLILPHGLLELTVVFIAAGAGLRLGWTVIDPGPRPRARALAEEGRAAIGMVVGLGVVLLISGAIEGFVTPSGLPTWARVGIGVLAEVVFLVYVFVLGRRVAAQGELGDVEAADRTDVAPAAA